MKNPFSLVVSFFGWIFDRTLLIFELSVDLTLSVLDSFLRVFRILYEILEYMIYYRTLLSQPPRSESALHASARPNKLITAGANRIGIVVLGYLNASDCSSATASRIAAARSNSNDFAA